MLKERIEALFDHPGLQRTAANVHETLSIGGFTRGLVNYNDVLEALQQLVDDNILAVRHDHSDQETWYFRKEE